MLLVGDDCLSSSNVVELAYAWYNQCQWIFLFNTGWNFSILMRKSTPFSDSILLYKTSISSLMYDFTFLTILQYCNYPDPQKVFRRIQNPHQMFSINQWNNQNWGKYMSYSIILVKITIYIRILWRHSIYLLIYHHVFICTI